MNSPARSTRVDAPSPNRIRELDLLRFAAAMLVVLYHYTYRRASPFASSTLYPVLERATKHGYLGVNLFFMISGFVILWTARDRPPAAFVISRLTRLYPEFWVAVLLSSAAFSVAPLGDETRISITTVLANLTMVPQLFGAPYVDGVYWTLFVELKFYVLLWLLAVAGQMPHIERWVYGWLALATYCFAFDGSHLARQLSIHPFGPFFIAGCLFFLVRFDRLTRARASALLLSLGLSIVSALGGIRGFVHPSDLTASSRVETVLVVVLAFGAFWLIARRRTELPMAARLAFLGALTYPLYLVHNIAKAGLAAYGRNLHPWVQFAVALAFSLALANAMTVNIERRFRKPITRWLTLRYTWCRSGLLGLFEGSA